MSRKRLSRRARRWLALVLCLAVAAAAAGLVLSLRGESRAQPAAGPGSGTTAPAPGLAAVQADLSQMQALLNTGSVSKQAVLLMPGAKFAPGSGPVFPAGTIVTIRPGTLHKDGQLGTVEAGLGGGKTVTLALYAVQGHWHLFDVIQGTMKTTAEITRSPGSQPGARLMSMVTAHNHVPLPTEIRKRTAVIFVHGWMPGNPAVWGSDSQPGSMFATVDSVLGTWTTAFDWSPTNGEWAGNPANGPALAQYIHDVHEASLAGHGTGKVIIVAHSAGGLLTRYAANTWFGKEHVADDIGMVITIGTPNTGSYWSNAGEDFRKILCWEQTYNSQNVQLPSDFCRDWTALSGMSVYGDKIATLPELPSQIPLFAIAGNEVIHMRLGLSVVDMPMGGDLVVTTSSALHRRSNGGAGSYTSIQNPPRVWDFSAWHGALPQNKDVIAMVHDLVNTYIRAHPAPAPVYGSAYWLNDGGKWFVHGVALQIEPGDQQGLSGPPGYVGIETWNAGGNIWMGTQHLDFVTQPDGSLLGTYTDDANFTLTGQPNPSGIQHDPATTFKGDMIRLVPVGPMHVRVTYINRAGLNTGNTNFCQAGLPDASNYCGA